MESLPRKNVTPVDSKPGRESSQFVKTGFRLSPE